MNLPGIEKDHIFFFQNCSFSGGIDCNLSFQHHADFKFSVQMQAAVGQFYQKQVQIFQMGMFYDLIFMSHAVFSFFFLDFPRKIRDIAQAPCVYP